MTYQEKRALLSVIDTIAVTTLYAAVMMQRYPQADAYAPAVFHFWGSFFLILIPVTVVAKVLVTIAFSIYSTLTTGDEEPSVVDERDQMIELKSLRLALYVMSLGLVLAMGALVISLPPAAMFIALICAGMVAAIVADLAQFYFYRRGV